MTAESVDGRFTRSLTRRDRTQSLQARFTLAIPEVTSTPLARSSGRLLKVLGVAFGAAVIVGNSIGAGILRTPGEIAARLPTEGLFLGVWIAGGVYALLGALSLAELGAMLPRSGGQYVFVRRALGEYAGFVVGWNDWIATCGSAAAIAIVIGEYLAVLFPRLAVPAVATAATVVAVLAVLQLRGIRWGDRIQQVTSLFKTLTLVGLVVAILWWSGRYSVPVLAPPNVTSAPQGTALIGALVLALQGVIYTYDGWNAMLYFSEEVREPGRDIPRGMVAGVLLVIAIYLMLNLAFLHVLPLERMANEPFVAGAAAAAVFGPLGDTIIRTIVIVSSIAAVNACIMMAPRVPLAMARDGFLPRGITRINLGGTPSVATVASALIALGFLMSGSFERVLALLAFFFVAAYTLSFASVFVLRRREPEIPRPYRAWGYPWTTGLVLLGSIAFLVGQLVNDTRNSLWSLALLAASYPVFLLLRRTAW